jgi:uncharacterized membrane protein
LSKSPRSRIRRLVLLGAIVGVVLLFLGLALIQADLGSCPSSMLSCEPHLTETIPMGLTGRALGLIGMVLIVLWVLSLRHKQAMV